ncbi:MULTISPECIES: NAD(+) diphosphatase [Thalassospira]|uniref:NAD(+) diphosphatase n=1 Tax=Thalassospira alkalitolerans TaxID=1293890 RepID=A0A1Y2LGA8_9PROT|nr:NAD(+) diphosphatase [Thalassospira alkalitolerans]OSQ50379.1 NADH pyrophosphatase [Thalassospira alkalitolerans]|tara:strand:+ start:42273 stop:43199 length:927 start_codon:yes stop_codon:yes gene_type:complete
MDRLFYEATDLDRDAQLRSRENWREILLAEDTVRILICHNGDPLFAWPEDMNEHELVVVGGPALPYLDLEIEQASWIYIGRHGGEAVIAIDIAPVIIDRDDAIRRLGGGFGDMRSRMAALSEDEAALAAQARAIFNWHQKHQYCGVCGHPNHVMEAGYRLQCGNDACATPHFPRTDPAVIMLIHQNDQVLLARSPQFLPGMVSVLAGFVEPGETLEQAVAREVYEEVGIRIKRARYVASQPWPFPGSLMLGFIAEAETTDIVIDEKEIEFAMWVHRDEVAGLPDKGINLPRPISIARYLLENWCAGRI